MFARSSCFASLACLSLIVAACSESAGEDVSSSEGMLLPNSTMFDVGHDGEAYRKIAEHFQGRGLDVHVDTTGFAPAWPLNDTKTAVLNRLGTPILYSSFGYYHTGFDVMRSASNVAPDVVAPHDGLALVFDWSGNRLSPSTVTVPYSMVVAIYDPVSHVITEMMHVAATSALAAATEPVQVTKGDVIGKLAPAPVSDSSRLAHVQVNFVDGENKKLLNPATLFGASYHDAVAPEAKGLYIADADAKVQSELVNGKLDLVVEAVDRDDESGRNLEVSAIAYEVKDQNGAVLASSARCNLDNLYESIAAAAPFRANQLIDFGSAKSQVSGGWPLSDVDNPMRSFRYALTNLAVDANGKCSVKDDADGFLEVADAITKISVSVTLWDPKGNTSSKSFDFARSATPAAPPPPPADAGPAPACFPNGQACADDSECCSFFCDANVCAP